MGSTNDTTQKAIVLWMSGMRSADIGTLPEVQRLKARGSMVELETLPITGPLALHYQALSGQQPSRFGYFDVLMPRDYAVVEESGEGASMPKLLPDVLRTAGWTVQYEETSESELVACIQLWAQSAPARLSCLIVKCVVGKRLPDITQAVRIARQWAGEAGLVALFSDMQRAPVKRFVNVNNFLEEMGLIERDEQSGFINWTNSLAYYAGNGQIWINQMGRDTQGVVHPQDEYEEVRDALVKALPGKLCDPENGVPVVECVYRREELYSEEYRFRAPDLVLVFKPGYAPSPQSTRLGFDDAIFTTPAAGTTTLAGVHPSSIRGFLLTSGPAIVEDLQVTEPAPLTSVTPTLLHALNVDYGDMETSPVAEFFLPSYLESHPIKASTQGQGLSEEEEQLIFDRLRDLGYV